MQLDGGRHHAEGPEQHGEVEPGEMEDLRHSRIGQHALEYFGRARARHDLHDIGTAVAARDLDDAEPITMRIETQRLGIDGDGRARHVIGREIAAMDADDGLRRHRFCVFWRGNRYPGRVTPRLPANNPAPDERRVIEPGGYFCLAMTLVLDPVIDALCEDLLRHELVLAVIGPALDDRCGARRTDTGQGFKFRHRGAVQVDEIDLGRWRDGSDGLVRRGLSRGGRSCRRLRLQRWEGWTSEGVDGLGAWARAGAATRQPSTARVRSRDVVMRDEVTAISRDVAAQSSTRRHRICKVKCDG